MFGTGNGEFARSVAIPRTQSSSKPGAIVAADLNDDAFPDLAIANFEDDGKVRLFHNVVGDTPNARKFEPAGITVVPGSMSFPSKTGSRA